MFDARVNEKGEVLLLGRLDASQVEKAHSVFDKITSSCTVDFKDLDYISSAGLAVLLVTQKRLAESGNKLIIVHLNKHIRDVFRYAGFDKIFEVVET